MEDVKEAVRAVYGKIGAREEEDEASSCCAPSCCSGEPTKTTVKEASARLGYSESQMDAVPQGANLGLGCGNPTGIAGLKAGEVVLDLGSGGGFDCFLAADQVGPTGQVIGVDMTPEMLGRARRNADKAGVGNVEFRLGEIEHLPVENESVDVILSNCVINLSPDKRAVYREAFRVLKPGGRLAISDVLATAELPAAIKGDLSAYTGCIAGAESIDVVEGLLTELGFEDVRVEPKDSSREIVTEFMEGANLADYIVSANILATRP